MKAMTNNTWTVKQLEILSREYECQDLKILATKLGKTTGQVRKKAMQLKIMDINMGEPKKTKHPVKKTKAIKSKKVKLKEEKEMPSKPSITIPELEKEISDLECIIPGISDMKLWNDTISKYNYLCLKRENLQKQQKSNRSG